MKELDRKDDELDRKDDKKGYDHPEVAWIIIGGAIGATILIHIFWWGFICGTGM